MQSSKDIFKFHQAQTFSYASCLEIDSAKGSYIYDVEGNKYLDFIAGVSACTLGHSNPVVINAVKDQLDKFTHVMVYGEYVQSPQYRLAKLLSEQLPESLCTSYFVNSGTESIEGAMKLSKRATGRSEIISCKYSYYGSTHGALSIMGNEAYKSNYRPLLSDCNQIIFNDINSLKNISNKTAAVFVEPIQGASGFIPADYEFLLQLRKKCDSTGSLLVFDEIQTGFGRLGTLFAFQHFNIVPDILCLAKGMGGGMPIGAFISSFKLMNLFTHNPELGHITTFGGHPVNCAASLSVLQYLLKTNLLNEIKEKEMLFRENLVHPKIKEIRGIGLMLSIELDSEVLVKKVVDESMKNNLLLFYFLFTKTSFRITPPLTISNEEIIKGCKIIKRILG